MRMRRLERFALSIDALPSMYNLQPPKLQRQMERIELMKVIDGVKSTMIVAVFAAGQAAMRTRLT